MFDDDSEDAVTVRVIAGGSLLVALLSVVVGLKEEGDLSLMWVIRDQRSCLQSHDLYPVTAATPQRRGGGGVLLDAEMFDEYVIGAADRMKVSLPLVVDDDDDDDSDDDEDDEDESESSTS